MAEQKRQTKRTPETDRSRGTLDVSTGTGAVQERPSSELLEKLEELLGQEKLSAEVRDAALILRVLSGRLGSESEMLLAFRSSDLVFRTKYSQEVGARLDEFEFAQKALEDLTNSGDTDLRHCATVALQHAGRLSKDRVESMARRQEEDKTVRLALLKAKVATGTPQSLLRRVAQFDMMTWPEKAATVENSVHSSDRVRVALYRTILSDGDGFLQRIALKSLLAHPLKNRAEHISTLCEFGIQESRSSTKLCVIALSDLLTAKDTPALLEHFRSTTEPEWASLLARVIVPSQQETVRSKVRSLNELNDVAFKHLALSAIHPKDAELTFEVASALLATNSLSGLAATKLAGLGTPAVADLFREIYEACQQSGQMGPAVAIARALAEVDFKEAKPMLIDMLENKDVWGKITQDHICEKIAKGLIPLDDASLRERLRRVVRNLDQESIALSMLPVFMDRATQEDVEFIIDLYSDFSSVGKVVCIRSLRELPFASCTEFLHTQFWVENEPEYGEDEVHLGRGTNSQAEAGRALAGKMNANEIKKICDCLEEDPDSRLEFTEGGILALAGSKSRRAIGILVKRLHDVDHFSGEAATQAVSLTSGKYVTNRLSEVVNDMERDTLPRLRAAQALAAQGADRKFFVSLTRDPRWELRLLALREVGTGCDPESIEHCIRALSDRHPRVRDFAATQLSTQSIRSLVCPIAQALVEQQSPEAVQSLAEMFLDLYVR